MIPSCELLIAIDRASGGRASAARPRRREPPSHISSVRSQTSNSPRSTPTPSAPNRRMLPSSDGVAPSRRASFANSQSFPNSISGSAQATAIPSFPARRSTMSRSNLANSPRSSCGMSTNAVAASLRRISAMRYEFSSPQKTLTTTVSPEDFSAPGPNLIFSRPIMTAISFLSLNETNRSDDPVRTAIRTMP